MVELTAVAAVTTAPTMLASNFDFGMECTVMPSELIRPTKRLVYMAQ